MAPGESTMRVCVAYSPASGSVDEVALSLGAGATVADALLASGLQLRHAGVDLSTAPVGGFSPRGSSGGSGVSLF